MTWYVLRHAEKEQGDFHNPQLKHQDQPLSARGKQDAQKLASLFADKPIAAIYVSAYQRTWQTAANVAEHLQLTPMVDSRLNEIDNGLVDEMTEREFEQAYPEVWKAYVARTADFRFPGGENGTEVQARVKDFFDEKLLQHKDADLLIVSHDGWIRQMMCHVLGLPVYRRGDFRVNFCGLTELQYQEKIGRWRLIRFNQSW
ncbi:MAG: histidine phosphatase family protein [Chloroflexi bacterium]|nr:histidine phosphatase family protein [Chloroflexota bacterium]